LVGLRSGQLEFDRQASDVSSQQIAGLYLAEAS
jgi:phosphonate transport system ATP-binding protein